MKVARILLAVALALAVQTTLARLVFRGVFAVDLVFVVVVYVALTSGPVAGLLTGALAGLVQDSLSSGIIGVGGLTKTVIGFLVGVVGTQFIVSQPFPRFVVFLGATVLHAAMFAGLYALVDVGHFGTSYAAVVGQAVGNAVMGVAAFQLAELLPGALERRRIQRTRVRR